ncbi:MAG: hypothetical protein Q9225_005306 [Loekoesia sp. 1 TL-2023]
MAGTENDLPGAHNYSFKTERLFLRPLRFEDIAAIFALKSNPKVYYWARPQTHESEARDWIRAGLENARYCSFCIEELSDTQNDGTKSEQPQVIGMCGGTVLPEIGYMLRPSVWGRGYATEALRGFIKFYWETFPEGHPNIPVAEERTYLKARTGPADEAPQAAASIAVLKKCGFEYWKEEPEVDTLSPTQNEVMLPVWRKWGPGYSSEESTDN